MNSPFPFISFFPNHDFPCTKPHAKSWTCSKLEKTNINKSRKQKNTFQPGMILFGTSPMCIYKYKYKDIYPMSSSYSTPALSLESANFLAISNKRCLGASSSDFSKAWVASQRRCRWRIQRMWSPSQQHTSLKFGLVIFEIHVEKKTPTHLHVIKRVRYTILVAIHIYLIWYRMKNFYHAFCSSNQPTSTNSNRGDPLIPWPILWPLTFSSFMSSCACWAFKRHSSDSAWSNFEPPHKETEKTGESENRENLM